MEQTIQTYSDHELTEKQFFEAFKTQTLTPQEEDLITEIDLWQEARK